MTADGRVALVTGANRGLGRETARQLAERGVKVLLGCRDRRRSLETAAVLAEGGAEVVPVVLDVTVPSTVEAVAARIAADHGRLDALVNNAGIFVPVRAADMTADALRPLFEVHVLGAVTVIHGLLPLLQRSASPRIVNVSSSTASLALTAAGADLPGNAEVRPGYTSAKAALNMLTLQYAMAFAVDPNLSHVKVNSATPGYTATSMNDFQGTRGVEEGARIIVDLALLPADGPSGGFFADSSLVPW